MEFYVLTGDDEPALNTARTELLAGIDPTVVERIDVAADGGVALVQAVAAMTLFGGRRVVAADNLDGLDEAQAAALAAAAAASDALVVARAGSALNAKVKKALGGVVTIRRFDAPRGRQVGSRVDQMLAEHGIRVGGEAKALLAERAAHDLPRVASVCRQLAILEVTNPTAAQVAVLLGSGEAPGVPWDLTDRLEAGDLRGALRLAGGLEPLAVLGYLASRLAQAGLVVDAGYRSADEVADALKLTHRFQADKILTLARRLGAGGVATSWDVVAGADRRAKSGLDQQAVLDLALADLVPIWAASR